MKLKIKPFLYSLIVLFEITGCKTTTSSDNEGIVNLEDISQNKLSKLFKYTAKYNDTYFIQNENEKKLDYFKPIIYTYVKPLKEDKDSPQKVYAINKIAWKSSLDYFQNELKGKNVSYLERNHKIVFRHYFQDKKNSKQDFTKGFPKNNEDIINYLNEKKIKYKVLRKRSNNVLDLQINNQFFRIVANSNFCESYTCTDLSDSINIENYRNIIATPFR